MGRATQHAQGAHQQDADEDADADEAADADADACEEADDDLVVVTVAEG